MVELDHEGISIRRQCELLGVNRTSLYYQPIGESEENLQLMRLLKRSNAEVFTRNGENVLGSERFGQIVPGAREPAFEAV